MKIILKNEIFKFLLGVLLMLTVSALLAFNALLLWVATGPRSLATITPYIESALSDARGGYEVKIGETKLIWDGWRHPVDIRLQNVTILTGENKIFTVFPEIALGVDFLYLPLGRVVPKSLDIFAPQINLIQNDDKSFSLGFKGAREESTQPAESETLSFSQIAAPLVSPDSGSNLSRLRRVTVNNAALTVGNNKNITFFNAENLSLSLTRDKKGNIKTESNADIFYDNYKSDFRAEFSAKAGQRTIDGFIQFSELFPNILAGLFSDNEDVKSFAVPISGGADISFNLDTGVKYLGFHIKGGKGNISSSHLAAELPIDSLLIKGYLRDNFSDARLESFELNTDGTKISASGTADFANEKPEEKISPAVNADVKIENLASSKVAGIWPPALSPLTRDWVTQSINEGKISEATLELAIKKGDLDKPVLPREAIDAKLNVEGLKILYLPEHPPAGNVKGVINIDGLGLLANIESAEYLTDTKLTDGHVLIEDLNADNPYIKVDFHAAAPASDIVHFLGLPRLKHADRLKLKEKEISGKVEGEAEVGFYFFAPQGKSAEEAINYDVKSTVTSVSQKGFMGKFDIEGVSGKVTVNNKGVAFIGSGEANGAKASKADIKYFFAPDKNGFDTFMSISASADKESIKRFGYPEFDFLKGSLKLDAELKLGDKIEHDEATIDLTDSDIDFEKIAWKKPAGVAAKLELISEKKDGAIKINSFRLSGKKTEVKGSATLAPDLSEFSEIILKGATFGNHYISDLNYGKTSDDIKLSFTADSIDASGFVNDKDGSFSFLNFPAFELKAYANKLILGKDKEIAEFSGELSCDKEICKRATLHGKTGDKKLFSVKIGKNAKNERKIHVASDDAGSFLRALGIIDGMEGGELNLSGIYSRDDKNNTLTGRLTIDEHNIKNAPLLGRLLSMASLTGFFDALAGNGIRFKNLSIPFTLHNDVITVEKGKTYGSAIGITVDGTITYPSKTRNLEGAIVPSYTLNNVLGNVPLLGDIIIGGEGQGIFAARYKIKGSEGKEEVNVNPLSILTPGFLRGLFDVF